MIIASSASNYYPVAPLIFAWACSIYGAVSARAWQKRIFDTYKNNPHIKKMYGNTFVFAVRLALSVMVVIFSYVLMKFAIHAI
jgi:hypothetical protein